MSDGQFVLYGRIMPPLQAGEYRLTADQDLATDATTTGTPQIASLPTHITVRAPRFALPPDQVLSTFPPAMGRGSYGSRLPQVVLRRRTLPWERAVQSAVPRETPWLALVLIAEGEAELALNQPVAQCVTPGIHLDGPADAETGNCLRIRKSMLDRIFPTQADVPLLAHAREVDVDDTELMMGDDDGFLAVIIANRLPLPGVGSDTTEAPMKYVACLVNLEGQFTRLPVPPGPPTWTTVRPRWSDIQFHAPAPQDAPSTSGDNGPAPFGQTVAQSVTVASSPAAQTAVGRATVPGGLVHQTTRAEIDALMAGNLAARVHPGFVAGSVVELDPLVTFPVLLHWSFTSTGEVTFKSLMQNLDSKLLGSAPEPDPDAKPGGRDPIEVVETGHVGLVHRTRRGESVRSWYRGPLVAHPMADDPRLELAHAADQIRIVVPDGREDISLAAAFEIGRLLALSQPSMIAAMLRWRQTGYQAGRSGAVWQDLEPFVRGVLGVSTVDPRLLRDPRLGVLLGRGLAAGVAQGPQRLLGDPAPMVHPGRPLGVAGSAAQVLARGFGLDVRSLTASPTSLLDGLRAAPVIRNIVAAGPSAGPAAHAATVGDLLSAALANHLDQIGSSVGQLAPEVFGQAGPGGGL